MKLKQAFTLVELMIVIAIIAVLAGVLMAQFGGMTESARATKCRSNMRNLAQAAQSYAVSHERYPLAGSQQLMKLSSGNQRWFFEGKGWIGWNPGARGVYPVKGSGNGPISSSWNSPFSDDQRHPDKGAQYAVTNGTLWAQVHDFDSYVCPNHRKLCRKNGFNPYWSYVMNAFFGYDYTNGRGSSGIGASASEAGRVYGNIGQAVDRTLMFAELQFVDIGCGTPMVQRLGAGNTDGDCTLQFRVDDDKFSDGTRKSITPKWQGGHSEFIGFNHKAGTKRVAHVVFADSHVELLVAPDEITEDRLKRLTANLCNGVQVTLSGGRYLDIEGRE